MVLSMYTKCGIGMVWMPKSQERTNSEFVFQHQPILLGKFNRKLTYISTNRHLALLQLKICKCCFMHMPTQLVSFVSKISNVWSISVPGVPVVIGLLWQFPVVLILSNRTDGSKKNLISSKERNFSHYLYIHR